MTTIKGKCFSRGAIVRAFLVTCLATVAPVFGQSADDASYDLSSTTEIRGVVVKFAAAPGGDAVMQVAAPTGNNQTQQWTVALGKASEMRAAGLTPLSLAPGVQLVISGNPAANASDHRLLAQKVTTADGFAWTR